MDKRNGKAKKGNQKKQNSSSSSNSKRDSEFSSEFMNGLKTESNTKQEQK